MSIQWSVRLRALDELDAARTEGFNHVQLPVGVVLESDDADFPSERQRLLGKGVSFEVFESPLPKGVQVTEKGFNTYSWTKYLGTAIRRISELGCKTLVWGDGRSRLLPVEGDISTARENFYQFMFILCDIAGQFGISVCLEPLGTRRTNFLNSLEELEDSYSLIDKRNLSIMLSPRDLVELHVGTDVLEKYRQKLGHVQIEHPEVPESSVPPLPSDGYDYKPFFTALHSTGYDGTIALPWGSKAATLAYCKRLWDMASAAGSPASD